MTDRIQTHWEGCEKEHHACALARLDEARERIARLEEAAHDVLRYFTSGNDAPVERATIRNDSPAIHRLRAALGEVKR